MYGYSKERFVLESFVLVQVPQFVSSYFSLRLRTVCLWINVNAFQPPENIMYAALMIGGSFIIKGAALVVAVHAIRKDAAAEGMTKGDYVWRVHDPTSVAVMTEDGAAVTGLVIASASLVALKTTRSRPSMKKPMNKASGMHSRDDDLDLADNS